MKNCRPLALSWISVTEHPKAYPPAGGHAIDFVKEDIILRPALGDEEFIPLDSDQVETPTPGEIIFVEGKTVLTRRWTRRQGKHTLVVPETKDLEFNVDGLPPCRRWRSKTPAEKLWN